MLLHGCPQVRRLGEFHPLLSASKVPDGQDIDDPLYGNPGGEEETAAVVEAVQLVTDSCRGLAAWLQRLREEGEVAAAAGAAAGGSGGGGGAAFRERLAQRVQSMGTIAWLVPPMMQGAPSGKAPQPFV